MQSIVNAIRKKYIVHGIIIFCIFVGYSISYAGTLLQSPVVTVAFLDVGQGDAIWIQAPNGKELLIDTGAGQSVVTELSKLKKFFDRTIDIVLLTHPDSDHIGGVPEVFKRYHIPLVITSEVSSTTLIYKTIQEIIDQEKSGRLMARLGERIILDSRSGVVVDVLFPDSSTENWETNEASIVVKVTHGDISFLLTGDALIDVEDYLIDIYGEQLQSTVLKLGHHGSQTSTGDRFLETVQPEIAIVSAGLGNRYGHPHPEVVERVTERDIALLETARNRTIICTSNAKTVICN
jgi:competence protein ComEC